MPNATFPAARLALAGLLLAGWCSAVLAEDAPADDEQLRKAKLYADVVMRLKGADLSSDAKTKSLVDKALTANQGLPAFVEIADAFQVTDRDPDLLRLAVRFRADATGAQAVRLVLAHGGSAALAAALEGPDAAAVVTALGNASDGRALNLLLPLLSDGTRALAVRQEAVRAAGRYEAGAKALLDLSKGKKLAADCTALAASVLANAPWESIRAEVGKAMAVPETTDGPLPSFAALSAKPGNAAHGEQLFGGICVTCHQVNGKGIDFGPNLSEIGTKLGKDALYEAVVYPDAGIEFNYETTVLTLKDGNSAIGIVVSDTEAEVALKAPGAIVTKFPKSAIASQAKLKTSLMPTGLQRAMSQQDLIDLIEFLASLKKK
jgi:putative heme-binding domain-containing protein